MNFHVHRVTDDTMMAFVGLMHEFHECCKLPSMPYSHAHAMYIARACLDTEGNAFGAVAFLDDGLPCGAIAGYVGNFLSSGAIVGTVEGIYVREGTAERPKIANFLLSEFRRWAYFRGAVALQTAVIAGIDNLGADIFYRRNGFTRTGIVYGQLIGEQ